VNINRFRMTASEIAMGRYMRAPDHPAAPPTSTRRSLSLHHRTTRSPQTRQLLVQAMGVPLHRGVRAMDKELVEILVADLVVLTLVLATAVPAMVAEVRHLARLAARPLRRALTARRVRLAMARAATELEQARALLLAQMPAPLPVLHPDRMPVQRPLSQETLQALREPKLRLVPLPPVLLPPTPMRSSQA
jgi:hypothetical protein